MAQASWSFGIFDWPPLAGLAGLQKTATDAMQTASHQVAAAVDEMRKRMADLQAETQQAMGATKESRSGSADGAGDP